MKNKSTLRFIRIFALFLCLVVFSGTSLAQTTTFTYQGRLTDSASAANGTYEMQFALYDAASNGSHIGSTITNTNVSVSNGIFSVELDFGASSFPGADRWLEISVKKPSEGSYTTLTPRQKINSTPYAIRATSAVIADTVATTSSAGTNVVSAINASSSSINTANVSGDVELAPSTQQVTSTTNHLINLKLVGSRTLGTAGQDALLSLSASGTYPDTQTYDKERFRVDNDGSLLAVSEYNSGCCSNGVPIEGSGTRFMWHGGKAAIRAGGIDGTQWNDANIGLYSTAFGQNVRALGDNSLVVGKNSVAANTGAVALGEGNTATGANSVALGYGASTSTGAGSPRLGSFVFSDRSIPLCYYSGSTIDPTCQFHAEVTNAAHWRVSNGFRIYTSSNLSTGVTIQSGTSASNWGQTGAVISTSTGAMLTTGGVWQNASSRYLKTNFAPVNSRSILQKVLSLPIQTWNYKAEDAGIRHIGAVSQDFYNAFNVGNNNEGIGTVDADGVALAAIQGLNEELKDRDAKIEEQQKQLTLLQEQVKQQQATLDGLKKLLCSANPQADVCK